MVVMEINTRGSGLVRGMRDAVICTASRRLEYIKCPNVLCSLSLQYFTGLECGHKFCMQCWSEYLTTKIMEEGMGQVKCQLVHLTTSQCSVYWRGGRREGEILH